MKYKVLLLTTLAAALLLSGCGRASAPSSSPSQSQPDVSASAPSSNVPDASQPDATKEPAPSDPVLQVEPPTSFELPTDEAALLAACDSADWSWFDDAVFIGDSVSLKLKNYVTAQRQNDPAFFGGAQFLTSGSLGSANALWEVSDKSVHPTFQGEKMLLEQSIPLTGAKKVYMMLGINDIAVYGIDGAVENYGKLMDQILEAAPDVEFYLQSATPICEGGEKGALNNENLVLYDEALEQLCEERGIHFVDVAKVMRGEGGFLPREYCSDPDGMGIHMTDLACRVWLGYLSEDAKAIQGL